MTLRVPCTIIEMHEKEETCTSAYANIEEQPSSSIVGEAITPEEGTLVAVQDFPKLYQGMHIFLFPIISTHIMESCGNVPLHDLGSNHIADLEQQTITALSNLDLYKGDIYNHPSVSFLSCTQLLGLECRFLEDVMSIFLNNAMKNYVFNIEHDLEIEDAPLWRSTMLSLSSSDELGRQPLLRHSNDHSTCVVGDRQMVDETHLIFHCYDVYSLMSTSLLNEKIFPLVYLDPYGSNLVIED